MKEQTAARIPAPAPITRVPVEERQKRQAVYTMSRQKILVKFTKMDTLPGLEKKQSTPSTQSARALRLDRGLEAQHRGLDFTAYRQQGDTGHCLIEVAQIISGAGLVDQLLSMGLHYMGGHWQERAQEKSAVSVLQFSVSDGDTVPLPDDIRRIVESTFTTCSVWCNLRFNNGADETDGQHRLDTINFTRRLQPDDIRLRAARKLIIAGNTYRLV